MALRSKARLRPGADATGAPSSRDRGAAGSARSSNARIAAVNAKQSYSYEHLKNSLNVFKALEEKVARWDYEYTGKLIAERKFEQLEMYTMNLLMGIGK